MILIDGEGGYTDAREFRYNGCAQIVAKHVDHLNNPLQSLLDSTVRKGISEEFEDCFQKFLAQ